VCAFCINYFSPSIKWQSSDLGADLKGGSRLLKLTGMCVCVCVCARYLKFVIMMNGQVGIHDIYTPGRQAH
jgi:hypothetical protein